MKERRRNKVIPQAFGECTLSKPALIGLFRDRQYMELMLERAREEESHHSIRVNIILLWCHQQKREILNQIRVAQARNANKRLDDLTAKLEALAEKPEISYRGVFDARERYKRGDFCTWDGSMWHCKRDSVNEAPSYSHDGSSPGQLAVKNGRAARET